MNGGAGTLSEFFRDTFFGRNLLLRKTGWQQVPYEWWGWNTKFDSNIDGFTFEIKECGSWTPSTDWVFDINFEFMAKGTHLEIHLKEQKRIYKTKPPIVIPTEEPRRQGTMMTESLRL